MIILNNGPVPVRVAGCWLQPGKAMPVESLAVALRLMAANPDVVEAGKEPDPANDDNLTADVPAVEAEPEIIEPSTAVKRKK